MCGKTYLKHKTNHHISCRLQEDQFADQPVMFSTSFSRSGVVSLSWSSAVELME